jgi:hypothetical protein
VLFHREKQSHGPTQSILNGDSNKLSLVTNTSKRKRTLVLDNDDLLESNYLELQDGSTYKTATGRPMPSQVIGIVGGDKDEIVGTVSIIENQSIEGIAETRRSGKDILKTVRIEQSYQ